MKSSRYNYFFDAGGGRRGVFNTFTGALSVLTPEEEAFLKNYSGRETDFDIEPFVQMGYIIQDDIDEKAIVDFDRNYYSLNNRAVFRILTTTYCNASCYYCYEAGAPLVHMTLKTAEDVCRFIIERTKPGELIKVEWFGGEPLLNQEAIDYITSRLSGNDFSVVYTMASNGLLFTPDVVCKAKNTWNLERVQITIDGLEERFDEIKKAPGIENPFRRVCESIRLLSEAGIAVSVRIHYNDNKDELLRLIEYFAASFSDCRNIFYYFHPLYKNEMSVARDIVADLAELNEALVRNGLSSFDEIYGFTYKLGRCFATRHNSFTIAPDGRLYNCSHNLDDGNVVGSVSDFNIYNAKRLKFQNPALSEACADCVFLPICQGGCRAAELKIATMRQCFLFKEGIELALRQMIKEVTIMITIKEPNTHQAIKNGSLQSNESKVIIPVSDLTTCHPDDCWDCDNCGGPKTH